MAQWAAYKAAECLLKAETDQRNVNPSEAAHVHCSDNGSTCWSVINAVLQIHRASRRLPLCHGLCNILHWRHYSIETVPSVILLTCYSVQFLLPSSAPQMELSAAQYQLRICHVSYLSRARPFPLLCPHTYDFPDSSRLIPSQGSNVQAPSFPSVSQSSAAYEALQLQLHAAGFSA